jgi:hypothetical protein
MILSPDGNSGCRVFAMGLYRLAGICVNKWLAAEKRGMMGGFLLVIQATGLANMSIGYAPTWQSKATQQAINTDSLNLLQKSGLGREAIKEAKIPHSCGIAESGRFVQ